MLLNKRIPFGYIVGSIKIDIVIVTIIGLVSYYFRIPLKNNVPALPITIPAFLGTAISILISFKLSQSYDRWWEARKIWGSIVNDSRTLILQLQSFLSKGNESEIRKISFRHIGWCYSLGQSLRGLSGMQQMESYLEKEDLEAISRQNNKPLAILQLNSLHIAALKNGSKMDIFSLVQINDTLVRFTNAMGMAERIKNTVFPVTYRLFLRFFIYVFIVTLTISLADTQRYFEIPLLLLISSSFFLLEKAAYYLQDPFSNKPTDTPMTAIATTIEINIKQLINEKEVPQPIEPSGFYLL